MMTPDRFIHYKLGDERHDREHWELLQSMNDIVQSIKDGNVDNSNVDALLVRLREHFNNEVTHMHAINFPYIRPHVDDHDRMIRTLMSAIDRVTEKQNVVVSMITNRLEDLFIDHIDHFDRQYADFSKAGR